MKIIQISGGCSISSASRNFLRESIEHQAYNLDCLKKNNIKGEFSIPNKNSLFVRGDTTPDLILKTLNKVESFIGKIPPSHIIGVFVEHEYSQELLAQQMHKLGCQFIHVYRFNLLDRVICRLRDFTEEARANQKNMHASAGIQNSGSKFGRWRESKDREEFHISTSIDSILNSIHIIEADNAKLVRFFEKEGIPILSVTAEDILGFQSSDETEVIHRSITKSLEIFHFLKMNYDEKLAKDFILSNCASRKVAYKHSSLKFSNFTNDELKLALDNAGLGEFWRE